MKLRMILEKVKCEWLNPIKSTIAVRLTESAVTITYDQTLRAFKSKVNKKFPPTLSTTNPTRRHIQVVSGGSGGRNQFGRGRRGQGNGGGRLYKTRPDIKVITLQNGHQVEYHASFNFTGHVFIQMKQQDINMLKKECQ